MQKNQFFKISQYGEVAKPNSSAFTHIDVRNTAHRAKVNQYRFWLRLVTQVDIVRVDTNHIHRAKPLIL